MLARRAAALGLLALAGLALAQLYFVYFPFELPNGAGVAGLVAGTAPRPFVTRQLAPLLVRALAAATGADVAGASATLITLSCIGWLWALWALARAVFPPRPALAAALLAGGPVGLLFVSGGYLYDLPHLALYTLALALLARRRWAAYLVLFPWLALSRESAIWLTAVCALWAPRSTRPVLQLAVFALVRGWLAIYFARNPGQALELHLAEHLAFLAAYPLPNVLALSVYGAALLAALQRWWTQPPFLQAAAVTIPLVFAGYWLLGFPGEIRACLEAYPALYLLTFHTVWSVLTRRPQAQPHQAQPGHGHVGLRRRHVG